MEGPSPLGKRGLEQRNFAEEEDIEGKALDAHGRTFGRHFRALARRKGQKGQDLALAVWPCKSGDIRRQVSGARIRVNDKNDFRIDDESATYGVKGLATDLARLEAAEDRRGAVGIRSRHVVELSEKDPHLPRKQQVDLDPLTAILLLHREVAGGRFFFEWLAR